MLYLRTPAVFTYPLTTTLDICDTFGPRLLTTGVYSHYDFHLGVDWCAAENTPVHAVTTGTVQSFSGDCAPGTASCFVHLTHTNADGQTRYDHLGSVHPAITNSHQVTPGQVIGWVGTDTGTPSAYLHFEVHDGTTITQRAAMHPLSAPFLPWTNRVSPTVTLRGVYTDATGMTALVGVTSPYTEPDVITVSVTVSGTSLTVSGLDFTGTINTGTSTDQMTLTPTNRLGAVGNFQLQNLNWNQSDVNCDTGGNCTTNGVTIWDSLPPVPQPMVRAQSTGLNW